MVKSKLLSNNVVRYLELQRQMNELKEQQTKIKEYLIGQLGDKEEMLVDGIKVANKHYFKSHFDAALLKKRQPEIHAAYTSIIDATRFTVQQ